MTSVQFAPWSSDIEFPFFSSLNALKINHDKLNDAARKLVGRYEIRPSDPPERSARMQIHGNAFIADETPNGFIRAEGMIKNVNTMEEFKALDRTAIIERAGRVIWDAIVDGSIYSCPSLLASFHAIFFADLKKYRYSYHFAFPALHSDPSWKLDADEGGTTLASLGPQESFHLFDAVQTWRYSVDPRQHGFFLAKRISHLEYDALTAQGEDAEDDRAEQHDERPTTPHTPKATDLDFRWVVGSLQAFENGFFNGVTEENRFVCFADPSTYAKNPGWMLRNLLVLARQRWKLESVQILCHRDTHARREQSKSLVLRVRSESPAEPLKVMPKVVGWERDKNNVLKSRLVDVSANMDPARIADQSADLNLKLIKWRIAPEIDLDVIKNTKCLLLGAGTLGSYVSRNLLGWGVRKITFVDNAKVSFSNPVRQPLYFFKDCLNGGARKAVRAAEALKEIYPNVDAQGYALSVPMAGHPITDEMTVKEDFETLQKLIDEHDAIFLLMDTRESRWLPSVMGKAAGKLVLNAALGFDSFVVMRHGARETSRGADSLGCYFCNDVVAPADSMKAQTLDQQCTVTRPGVAAIASALLVELLVSVLQHPSRAAAPAPASRTSDKDPPNHPLGLVPHTIRGYLSNFENLLIRGPAYDCCSACSDTILDTYSQDRWEFVKRALNERDYVEELSGLKEVQRLAEEAAKAFDISDNETEGSDIDGDGEII